jgi:hypothetical protein
MSLKLRAALDETIDTIRTRRCFVVRMPEIADHSGHYIGPVRLNNNVLPLIVPTSEFCTVVIICNFVIID